MKLLFVAALTFAMCATGCSSSDDTRAEASGFVAIGQSDAPDGCGPDAVGRLVIGFFEAFNSGDIEGRVDEFIAPANRFAWFSVDGVGERFDDDAKDRSTLGSYLQERSDAGERLGLVAMDAEYEQARNITHIAYNVERTEPETLEGAKVVVGKGAIDCESGKIMVWSMGTSEGGPQALCRSAPTNTDPELPIVCVRESL
ncbi:MAG: hypothetical protein GY925_15100 [Actinomycetia bacterium]|nr:hypothetical protein [Actinomycetes bacterium]